MAHDFFAIDKQQTNAVSGLISAVNSEHSQKFNIKLKAKLWFYEKKNSLGTICLHWLLGAFQTSLSHRQLKINQHRSKGEKDWQKAKWDNHLNLKFI